MNMSLRKQLTVIFVGLVSAMFLANFLINTFFLEDFYYVRKQEALLTAYTNLNEDIDELGRLDDEEKEKYEELCTATGISFVVTDRNWNKLIWTENENDDNLSITLGRLNGYMLGLDRDVTVIEQNDRYTLQTKYDSALGINFLEMTGTLDRGFYFIMRISAESIRDSVRISNEFIKYICVIGVILTTVIVWFVSKQVTKPIRELTELSKRMAALDFDVKYTGGGTGEVGQLGDHFNQMSENLEKAYSQLLAANNELQKDIERKQKTDDMRKEFLSNVSHELKTPIALIQGYAEGLQECINDDPESREFYCEVIVDEAAKMNGLVQKLLTLNQLEFGNDQVSMERFDLTELIRNKIQSVTILAQQKDAQIVYEGSSSLSAWADEYKVEEVLTNYLSNALNHVSGERRIVVKTELRSTAGQPDVVRVSVFNTGEQIPETDIGLIWDKFYKVDKARTREYGGSGVGLSIVKAIMESFNREYGVRNLGDGVEFWFELLCDSAAQGENCMPAAEGESASGCANE